MGGDAKIPIGNALNLDLTLNPDFSQVEVDDQVVNVTRFAISLLRNVSFSLKMMISLKILVPIEMLPPFSQEELVLLETWMETQ